MMPPSFKTDRQEMAIITDFMSFPLLNAKLSLIHLDHGASNAELYRSTTTEVG